MDSSCAVRLLLLLGLALGLAAATTETPRSEVDVMIDLETDGLLVDQHLLTTLTTQAPHTLITPREIIQSIEILPPESAVKEESAPVEDERIPEEGSALGEDSLVGRVLRHSDSDNSSSTTPAPEVGGGTTTAPHEDKDLVITVTLGEILPFWIDAGSGHHETATTTEATAKTTVKTTTEPPTEEGSALAPAADLVDLLSEVQLNVDFVTTPPPGATGETLNEVQPAADLVITLAPSVPDEILIEVQPAANSATTPAPSVPEETLTKVEHEGGVFAMNMNTGTPQIGELNAPQVTEMPKGHVTPDWVIIVGFLVGVAALVLLCVAIATRDRWNRPSQFNQTGAGLQPADQQRALEMQTFLHEQQPRENGKAEEYTVIPLDELPETYSS